MKCSICKTTKFIGKCPHKIDYKEFEKDLIITDAAITLTIQQSYKLKKWLDKMRAKNRNRLDEEGGTDGE